MEVKFEINGGQFVQSSFGSTITNNWQNASPSLSLTDNFELEKVRKELAEIKSGLKEGSTDYRRVDYLEQCAKEGNQEALKRHASEIVKQIGIGAFANLVGDFLAAILLR